MTAVYIDLNIDCAEDNCKSEKVTGYEHGIKVFRFKPLNKNNPIEMTTAIGKLEGHIEVYFPTGTLKFYGVNFEVFPSPETAEIESKDEFTLLENAIAQAKNAYQIAVENGFVGTVEEWLKSLKGVKGDPGTDGKSITSTEINESGELVLTYSDGSTTNVGVVKGKNGSDYVLTDTDKTEIANIVINEYDSSVMAILGGESDVTE